MSVPYYKRFARDFLEGTAGMDFELKGAYSILLDLLHLHEGRLPDNNRYIAGQMGCSTRKAGSLVKQLIDAGKLYRDQSVIRNERMDKVVAERHKNRAPKPAPKSIAEDYLEITGELPEDYLKIIHPINVENLNDFNAPKKQETEPEPETDINNPLSLYDISECERDEPDGFDEFWEVYPSAIPTSRTLARNAWRTITAGQAVYAIGHARQLAASGKQSTLYAHTFLADLPDNAATGPPPLLIRTDAERAARMDELNAAFTAQKQNEETGT